MNITINDIAIFLGIISGIITSIGIIMIPLKKFLIKTISEQIEPISKEVAYANQSIKELDIGQCKNFLVRFLADVEQGQQLDPVEKERAYEIYDRYTNDLKQNSYIHKRWNELMK